MKTKFLGLATTCTLALAFPLTAAHGPAAKTNQKATTTAARRSARPEETLSGKITMVRPDQKLVVVETANGIPFDMVVTTKTRITSGGQAITLNDLMRNTNKTVSVKFIPESGGDVAKSIQITG